MFSQRLLSAAMQATRSAATRRTVSSASKVEPVSQARQTMDLAKFDPNNYNIPVRVTTMYDTMEPYGSWKVAYEAERRKANRTLMGGIVCLTGALMVVYFSGVFEGVIMPNLDNIMEDTEPFNFEKSEDRVSV